MRPGPLRIVALVTSLLMLAAFISATLASVLPRTASPGVGLQLYLPQTLIGAVPGGGHPDHRGRLGPRHGGRDSFSCVRHADPQRDRDWVGADGHRWLLGWHRISVRRHRD